MAPLVLTLTKPPRAAESMASQHYRSAQPYLSAIPDRAGPKYGFPYIRSGFTDRRNTCPAPDRHPHLPGRDPSKLTGGPFEIHPPGTLENSGGRDPRKFTHGDPRKFWRPGPWKIHPGFGPNHAPGDPEPHAAPRRRPILALTSISAEISPILPHFRPKNP